MPRFHYELRDVRGRQSIGSADAPNVETMIEQIEMAGWSNSNIFYIVEDGQDYRATKPYYIVEYNHLGSLDNNTYLIVDNATQEAALVDPSFDSEPIWDDIIKAGLNLRYILNTHAHFDHVIGNAFFAEKSGAPIALHRDDLEILHALSEMGQLYDFVATPSPEPTIFLQEGQTLTLGETKIDVLFTPGHAPGHVTFVVGEDALVGDVLFHRSIGRTDLPGGSLETLLHSIRTRLLPLPDTTQVLPGHGQRTSIGMERQNNDHLRGL